ncbi:protein ALTERED XYLOGLUCAN 4-like [Abrus precatorius]|uniref:Protein ALTERED XYLOGLUCAN 4-like n=1 Tax=Abrus precatorius TaxID=3816 RepID=A0A8B8LSJ5_ABRPR|nr:protein ALTERED XYLOGLUCAN 4-like [Abrus precatorius]
MKTSSTIFQEKHHNHSCGKRVRCLNNLGKGMPFVLTPLLVATIFSLIFLYAPNPLTLTPHRGHDIFENRSQMQQQEQEQEQHGITTKVTSSKSQKEQKTCDLFKGHWIPALGGSSSYYTNSSCTTIPDSKNCFMQGRKDTDFLHWKWKPQQCELPRFDPTTFLNIVSGKKMAFIGDSVARNHMDSLLCLLSQEEIPKNIYKDSEERFVKWYFPKHDFTLMMLWSRFLIVGEERMVNGTGSSIFDMHVDKVDEDWAKELPNLDYAIISDGHWFFRLMYLHEAEKLVGCVYCKEPNITDYNIDYPFRLAFRTAFRYINSCKECRKMLIMLRTFAPAHFENGVWNNGGYCNRTGPMSEGEVDFGRFEWQLRNVQMEEFERARNEGTKEGQRFEVVDVTKAMLMRPDGHPGEHWGNKWMRGFNDCTHWCLPGPIDMWSELLLAVLKREAQIT